jgi:hypothetical protein
MDDDGDASKVGDGVLVCVCAGSGRREWKPQ